MIAIKTNEPFSNEKLIAYDPGKLPTRPPPSYGAYIDIQVDGKPPYKDRGFSFRNRGHKIYDRFCKLRRAAISVMDGRAWYSGEFRVELKVQGPPDAFGKSIWDYFSGILDTLGGSSGRTFTYLPIVYEDDCQAKEALARFEHASNIKYVVRIEFA